MPSQVAPVKLRQHLAPSHRFSITTIGNNEIMFRSCGSCNGESTGSFFVTKDLNEGLPFYNQAYWLLNQQALEFALQSYRLSRIGEK